MERDALIDLIAKEVIRRLQEKNEPQKILIVSNRENHDFDALNYAVETHAEVVNPGKYAYIIISGADFQAIHSPETRARDNPPPEAEPREPDSDSGDVFDLTHSRVIQEREIQRIKSGYSAIRVNAKAIITPLARDSIRSRGLKLLKMR
ncbi:MAG: hypothetical protein LBB94_00715 [Clostridiales bacterium]|jgi:hypothetical protein|nr:hypothetical protein [Clostridiales bacterium]